MRGNFSISFCLTFMLLILLAYSQLLRNTKNKQFIGFQLYSQLPVNLVLEEVVRIKGVIIDPQFYTGNQTKRFILEVNFTKKDDKMVNFTCRDVYDIADLSFDMSCVLKKEGQFIVGLQATPSTTSQFKIKQYKLYLYNSSVIRTIKALNMTEKKLSSKQPPKPQGFKMNFINNLIELKWTSKAPLTNITFYMTLKDSKKLVRRQFLLSNNHEKFYPDFFEFRFFEIGQTFVEMSHANSQSGFLNQISSPFSKEKARITFKSMRHFREIEDKLLYSSTPALPERLKVAERYNFTITFTLKTRTVYFYVSIDYKISRKVKFYRPKAGEQDEIKEGIPVNVQLVFDRPGTYIIGLRSIDRQTISNHPVYVGEGVPFIPDYFDFYEYFRENGHQHLLQIQQQFLTKYVTDGKVYKDPGFFAPPKQQTAYLFQLLNIERQKYKAPPLTLDPTLTKMAQDHCDDMLKNKYLSVKNLKGQMPIDRGVRYNLTSLIRQYILGSYSLGGMHLDAQIKASFIEITANKMLTRVGIGIVLNYTNQGKPYHVVTYDFTIRDLVLDPPAPDELAKFRDNVVKVMMEKNPNILQQDKQLSADINTWIKQGNSTNAEDLEIYLDKKGSYGKDTKAWTREVYFYEQEMQNIRDDQNFDDKEGKKIGLGLGVNKESKSTLTAYVVFI